MAHGAFKEPFNVWYLLGVLGALVIAILPAAIGWFLVLT